MLGEREQISNICFRNKKNLRVENCSELKSTVLENRGDEAVSQF